MKTLEKIKEDYFDGVYDKIRFLKKRDSIEYLLDDKLARKDELEAEIKAEECILQDINDYLMDEYGFNKQQSVIVADYIYHEAIQNDCDYCAGADEIAILAWNVLHC